MWEYSNDKFDIWGVEVRFVWKNFEAGARVEIKG